MDDPVKEIKDVIRSITETPEAEKIAWNVTKYFTEDVYLEHPLLNQPRTAHGKDMLKGYYKMLRTLSINNKIEFHAVMFNQDRTEATIELTQHADPRFLPGDWFRVHLRFLVRLGLRKESDEKYRIYYQQDNFPTDLARFGLPIFPGAAGLSNLIKTSIGLISGILGQFLLSKRWFGA